MGNLLIDQWTNPARFVQHRFLFDKNAHEYMKWLCKDVPLKTILDKAQWAKPCYEKMYVEITRDNNFRSGFYVDGQKIWFLGMSEDGSLIDYPFAFDFTAPRILGVRRDVDLIEREKRACWSIICRAITALLILNQPSTHKVNRVDHKRAIVKGKNVVYKAHNLVTIDLNRDEKTHREFFNTGTRGTYRRHEVRGTWVHFHKHPGCTHAFVEREVKNPDPDRPRYICEHCGQFRTWKPSFERGDASKGWASKQYQVTHSGDNKMDYDKYDKHTNEIAQDHLDSIKQRTIIPCGGCGEKDSSKRCVGCFHDFGDAASAWVRNIDK